MILKELLNHFNYDRMLLSIYSSTSYPFAKTDILKHIFMENDTEMMNAEVEDWKVTSIGTLEIKIIPKFVSNENPLMTEEMYEKLKKAVFDAGADAIELLLGHELDFETDEAMEEAMDDVLAQMPEDIAFGFYKKFCE